MKRRVAYLVVVTYVVTIALLLSKQTPSDKIIYILGVIAIISFLFGVAERAQLYKFWPKGEILMNTPIWFKTSWWISLLFVLYIVFNDFESASKFFLISLSLGTAYLSPYLFVDEITAE